MARLTHSHLMHNSLASNGLAIASNWRLASDGSGLTVWSPESAGGTIAYPSLKPAAPTDDFSSAALGGSWSAHSNGGSFATANCLTGAIDGSSLEMQYSSQMGTLYRTHGNTDLDFTVGNVRAALGPGGVQMMWGIAALDAVGTGVGVVVYDDYNAYLASIVAYTYAANTDVVGYGMQAGGTRWHPGIWLRLKRVSGTWTGYASLSGRAWDKTFGTRADVIVVASLHVGLLYNAVSTYSGRLMVDYYQEDA